MTQQLQGMETQCFISYTRADNSGFSGVVDRLKSDLAGRFEATTGRTLRIFLDRESIGWGDDWRNNIRGSIESATFFLPVVTMRYFESGPCREELIAFYENAKQLGVTELITPVILAGANQITPEDPREEVRIIERLNHRNIEEAWLDGYESSAWLRMIHRMVQDLDAALQKAESAIATREQKSVQIVDEEHEEADISDLGFQFESITKLTAESLEALKSFGTAVAGAFESGGNENLSAKQRQVKLVTGAHGVRSQAQELSETGTRFEQKIVEVDAKLRAVVFELRDIKLAEAENQVQNLIGSLSGMDSLEEVLQQMDDMVSMMRLAAVTNVSLRKAVQPGITGIQSIRNGLATAQSWESI